ncbi:MFS transporter [Alkalihalobacillus sp. LMS6]|uniref:MFS transporter n=1 Tax=Alkalihalobacillus sp. LMS6 TaxID=2924034 RepID=UPI0020D096F0|nr:MFS transporter [Alkalihalobacillus sp. LMS6]UTR07282.1 MFS transporter [Alkalihalobacillus sp. LMS6]
MKKWKHPAILLGTTGLANIGDFIYLILINILVLQLTGSATAVAALWIIGPLVNIFTKLWTGSFIDYRSKRLIMMTTYLIRAVGIAMIAFAPNLFFIYFLLIVLSFAQSFFFPASITYTTMLVPVELRKRFNAIRSFTSSSAFIIGPAIGGLLLLAFSSSVTLLINAFLFVVAASLLFFLPEEQEGQRIKPPALTLHQVKTDFTIVLTFIKNESFSMGIYIAFQLTLLFTFALDVQEVVFVQNAVGLSELDYSFLISITGIGSLVSAIILSFFANHFTLRWMIASGMFFMTIGYVIYAFSWSFASIAVGFIILEFFNVIVNAGMTTFYQNHVPTPMMGRVTSIFQLGQSMGQIILVLLTGLIIDLFSLRVTIVVLALSLMLVALLFSVVVLKKRNQVYFMENPQVQKAKAAK